MSSPQIKEVNKMTDLEIGTLMAILSTRSRRGNEARQTHVGYAAASDYV